MKKTAIFLLAIAFVCAGCNTVRGIGQDIEKGGAAIEKSVK